MARKNKGEKTFSHKGVKYISEELKTGEICGDCEFFDNEVERHWCKFPKDIPCDGITRRDNKNIKWRVKNVNKNI